MGQKEELLDTLGTLAPQIDRNKALLELNASAMAVSSLLSEPQGLDLIEYIIEELDCGKKAFYSTNKYLEKERFNQIIETCYIVREQKALDVLLPLYHQLWAKQEQGINSSRTLYETLKKLENSAAIDSKGTALNVCLDCYSCCSDEVVDQCPKCNKNDLLKVYKASLTQSAKVVLKNGQYLEIYAKECLRKAGIELIGQDIDKHGKKAFTNIRYQVDGEQIDIDVHGLSQPLALLLCEAKTSTKIVMNEVRRVEDLFDRLINKLNRSSGREFNHVKVFVITGEFDSNISEGAYKRKKWEFIDRRAIQNLTEVLERIRSGI